MGERRGRDGKQERQMEVRGRRKGGQEVGRGER